MLLPNLIDGGAQERGKRAGTENVACIVGLAHGHGAGLRHHGPAGGNGSPPCGTSSLSELLRDLPRSRLNGHPTQRLPGNVNFCFEGIEGESLLLMLDLKGICASSGSACTSGSLDPSHVLLAIGLPHEVAHGSLRLTPSGDDNTMEDIDYIIETLPRHHCSGCAPCPPCGTPSSKAESTTTSAPNKQPGAQRPWNNDSSKDGFIMHTAKRSWIISPTPATWARSKDASGVGEVGNAKCGDIMKMYIKVEDGVITDVKFKTFGCGAAIATSSMATEMIKGKTIDEALQADQQGRDGGPGRAAAGEDPLLRAGRAGHQGGGGGLLPAARALTPPPLWAS